MRQVLFLSFTFQPEPGNVKGLPIAKWLRVHDYGVEVLTGFPQYPVGKIYPGYKTQLLFREEISGIPVCRVPIFPSHDLSAFRRLLTYNSFAFFASLYGIWTVKRADVVFYYDNTPTTGTVAWLYKKLRGAKVVMHVADLWPDSVLTSGMIRPRFVETIAIKVIRRWMNMLYRDASVITVLSPGFKDILIERGVPAEKIHLVYNSTEEDKFFPVPADHKVADELGIDPSKTVVLYAGNIGPMQCLQAVVEAAVLLKDRDDIQFVMMGTGPEETMIKDLAKECGADSILFVERQPLERMNSINALADALLIHLKDLPFLHATIPSKTQGALASARPILIGVKGDAAELVERAGAGYAFTPESAESLAQAVEMLADLSSEERQEMGVRGRKFYERELCTEVCGKQMDKIFEKVLSEDE